MAISYRAEAVARLPLPGSAEIPASPSVLAIAAEYRRHHQPASPEEHHLIDTLAQAEWLLRRLYVLEAHLLDRDPPPSATTTRQPDETTALSRRIDAADRRYHRALTALQRIQKQRPKSDPPPAIQPVATPVPTPCPLASAPPAPPLPDWITRSGHPSPPRDPGILDGVRLFTVLTPDLQDPARPHRLKWELPTLPGGTA